MGQNLCLRPSIRNFVSAPPHYPWAADIGWTLIIVLLAATGASVRLQPATCVYWFSRTVLRFQRHNYLHENLVRSGLVWEPWHYRYRSTVDYYTNKNGLVSIADLWYLLRTQSGKIERHRWSLRNTCASEKSTKIFILCYFIIFNYFKFHIEGFLMNMWTF